MAKGSKTVSARGGGMRRFMKNVRGAATGAGRGFGDYLMNHLGRDNKRPTRKRVRPK